MKRYIVAALLGAALLTACTPKDDAQPPMLEGTVSSKWIEDWNDPEPCYKLSLTQVKRETKGSGVEVSAIKGYECVPIKAYESLNPGDYYRQSDWSSE